MKNLKFLIFAIAAALPLTQAGPAMANDKNDSNDKGGQGGGKHGGHERSQTAPGGGARYSGTPTSGVTRFSGGGGHGQSTGFHSQHVQSGNVYSGGRVYSGAGNQTITTDRPSYNYSTGKGYRSGVSGQYYNQSNNWGGRWSPANTHPDWNHNQQYYWNNHHYGWFNGGWLIIDGGFWPYGYSYPYGYYSDRVYQPNYYYGNDSTIADVQENLARMGYYNGVVDGAFGPMTSSAIRRYQYDNGLPVTGRITPSLLNSLGLY